ncbi:MAG: hypothetical protein HDQ97_13355 [Lachnospiraceae bacterium]|nr:hypothetical protein [Lachnospiraceae bacterium]
MDNQLSFGMERDVLVDELLEITDEQWRNVVEGYLNTQRFYILVEPENFDIALGIARRNACRSGFFKK